MPRENKREAILQAAMRVFCFYGYDGATLEKIAGEAGVSKALVVKYYGTMRELLVLCLTHFLEEFSEKIEKNAHRKGNTYRAHLEYLFELFKLSQAQLRLVLTLFVTPAHETIRNAILPIYVRQMQNHLQCFPETRNLPAYKELHYTAYSLLVAYTIGGNEENYTHARDEMIEKFLGPGA